jgi:hypothetical protein
MELLQAGVDCSVIALWLGHESVETTQTYLHAHLALKEAAWQNSSRTSVASEPAFGQATDCFPSLRRCNIKTPDYAEWNWGDFRSMDRTSRTVRHSWTGGIIKSVFSSAARPRRRLNTSVRPAPVG